MRDASVTSVLARINEEFGSWTMDQAYEDLAKSFEIIHNTSRGYIIVTEERFAIKFFDRDDGTAQRELQMMLLAGDVSISALGRIHRNGVLYGIVMPYETALLPDHLTMPEKLSIIDELCILVNKLHEKGIIHGDIKPTNILRCSDGRIRLCDFGCASLIGESPPNALTAQYCSPHRYKHALEPLTQAEDLYATGISIWEIYTGIEPFSDIDEDFLESLIISGLRPDIALVDNPAISTLIDSYLDCGLPLPPREICTEREVQFRDCRTSPSHTTVELLRCAKCEQISSDKVCDDIYRLPIQVRNRTCDQCQETAVQVGA